MFKKIYLLLLMPLFLAGCVQTETQLTINKDNSAVYEQKFFIEESYFDGDEPMLRLDTDRNDKKKNLEAKTGMKFREYHEDGKYSTVGTKKIFDLRTDPWNTTLNNMFYKIKTKSKEGKIVDITKGFFKNDYVVDIKIMPVVEKPPREISFVYENANYVPTEEDKVLAAETDKEYVNGIDKTLLSQMRNTYMIKIPSRAYSHNSQNIDTKNLVYKWDLKPDSFVPVVLKFSVYNVVNIITAIIILLIIIGELFYFALYRQE